MTSSSSRTLVVGGNDTPSSNRALYGSPDLWWPDAGLGDFLDYHLDVTSLLEECETITAASLGVMPGGDDGLIPAFLTVTGNVISWWGYAVIGHVYHVKIRVGTSGIHTFSQIIGLQISPILMSYPSLSTPYLDFSPEINWSEGQFPMLGPIMNLPAVTVVATGTTQLTASPVPLAKLLVNAGPGGGICLPPACTFNDATVPVYNRTGGVLTIYPHAGDTIESNGVNAGVTLQDEQTANFSVANSGLLILA